MRYFIPKHNTVKLVGEKSVVSIPRSVEIRSDENVKFSEKIWLKQELKWNASQVIEITFWDS